MPEVMTMPDVINDEINNAIIFVAINTIIMI
jgi:hypothetical protein